ncbi:MAG: D-sedoheptulose-7-phosphate isomerase [Chloroflexota bacterium]
MESDRRDVGLAEDISAYLGGFQRTLEAIAVDDLRAIIGSLSDAYEAERRLFLIGNGGSASTASHLACDLAKTVSGKTINPRVKRFRAVALTDNVPLLTAWGNDAGYETIFAEQIKTLAGSGDLLLVISGSGNSPNILEAVKTARELGLHSIGLLGFDGGAVRSLVDLSLVIPSDDYGHIEAAHVVVSHLITAHFVRQLFRHEASANAG